MKLASTIFFMSMLSLPLLSACVTSTESANNFFHRQTITRTSSDAYPSKNRQKIAFYDADQEPQAAYRIIGSASVSKYNFFGIERSQQALKQQIMNIAASMGGDGVINFNPTHEGANANIIAFQQILI